MGRSCWRRRLAVNALAEVFFRDQEISGCVKEFIGQAAAFSGVPMAWVMPWMPVDAHDWHGNDSSERRGLKIHADINL